VAVGFMIGGKRRKPLTLETMRDRSNPLTLDQYLSACQRKKICLEILIKILYTFYMQNLQI
jgi:hypothetical protein